jgi:hypothetical protein
MTGKDKQEVFPRSPVKDEDLGLGVVSRDALRSCQSLFICLVFNTVGIVVEIVTITVNDAHDHERRRKHAIFRLLSFTLNGKVGTARRQKRSERRVTKAHKESRE